MITVKLTVSYELFCLLQMQQKQFQEIILVNSFVTALTADRIQLLS